jgi:hypothetical protein
MKSLRLLSVVFIVLILLVFAIIFTFRHVFSSKAPYTYTTSSETVIKEMKSLNRLETATFTIEKIIDAGTSGNTFSQFLFGDRLLLIAHGEVIAGFDLSSLAANDVQIEGSTLRLTLPPPHILITKLDSNQTRVYDRRTGVFSKGDKDLEANARAEAEKIITQAACTGNILSEASKNARAQLTTLFKSFSFATVIIIIPDGSC